MTTTSELVPDLVDGYLTFLGYADRPAPTVASLVELHRRHLARVPYENLEIMLGRPPSVAPLDSLARVGRVGRAGYCFHQNGALEVALRELGFAVERRHGHVWTSEDDRHTGVLNHLVLVVTGLPTDDNPGGEWWPDVGLGDALGDPLPLVVGEYEQGGFDYALTEVRDDGWSFLADKTGLVHRRRGVRRPDRRRDRRTARLALHAPRRAVRHGAGRAAPDARARRRGARLPVPPDHPGRPDRGGADVVRRLAQRDRGRLRAVAGRGRRRRAEGAVRPAAGRPPHFMETR